MDFLLGEERVILADEMGTGKTVQACAALNWSGTPDTLVICPRIAFGSWTRELPRWYPEAAFFVFTGTPTQRAKIWQEFDAAPQPKVLITNYAQLKNVVQKRYYWNAVIADECHAVKNRKTLTFTWMKKFRSRYLWLLSGTPMSRGPQDLWTYLHLINPQVHRGFWPYVNKWCEVQRTYFGIEIGGPRDAQGLKDYLEPYLLRRTKLEVLPDLPPKRRDPLDTELLPIQKRLYKSLAEEMIAELEATPTGEREFLLTRTALATITRLRQTCINPALYGGPNVSASFDAIGDFLNNLNSPCVIFTPWSSVFPLLAGYINSLKMKDPWNVYLLHGKLKDTAARAREFEEDPFPNKVLLCTTTLGAGFDAVSASHALFLGADWSPVPNLQSEDRLHREGQLKAVNIYYIRNTGTIEQHVLDVVGQKKRWADLVHNPRALLMPKGETDGSRESISVG